MAMIGRWGALAAGIATPMADFKAAASEENMGFTVGSGRRVHRGAVRMPD